ncbi:G-protein coupled receptor 61-like [Biomphalaria glabrata]|uniref:G-protein coupled receptor 61-like n=1 Tax=Biomphalaria glabrata TaxID=6526 RepID=A0A9W3A2G4_BIOGL|nr:G-protein coupled receptor 61-like [Biomphalaria glabrata]
MNDSVSLVNSTQSLLGYVTSGNISSGRDSLVAAEVFAVVLMSVTTLVAFQANLWIVVVVLITPQLRSSLANIFVLNLCCVDLLASGLSLPMSIATFVRGADGLSKTTCDVNGFFSTCVMVTSVLSLCAISIERYYTIAFPMHHAGHATPCLYLLALSAIWGVSLVVASLPLLGINTYRFRPSRRSCSYNWQGGSPSGTAFILLVFLISFLLPSIVLLSMYAGIFRVAKKAATVITPNANGISLSPVRSHVISSQQEDALFTVSGKFGIKLNTVSHDVIPPRLKITEVSHDSLPFDANDFSRRLSVEDSGIRTADFTDAMSAHSLFTFNNNDRLNDVQCVNANYNQELTPSVHFIDEDARPLSETSRRVVSDTQPSTTAHPISETIYITNSEQTEASIPSPVFPNTNRVKSGHIKAFKTLMIIVVSYLVQWGPYFACLLHELSFGQGASEVLELIVSWLSYSSYAVNPVLYGCMNRQIREELTQLLTSAWRCCCCYFACPCSSKSSRRGSSCFEPQRHKHSERNRSRELRKPMQEVDVIAGEAESFYQFLQRTQDSDETLAVPDSNRAGVDKFNASNDTRT